MAIADPDVLSATAGDEAAMGRLYRRHNGTMKTFAFRILRDDEAAADAVQDAWGKIALHIRSFRGDSTFGTWAVSIARNEALMALRRQKAANEIRSDDGEMPDVRVGGLQSQRMAKLDAQRLIALLPDGYREVVQMAYLGGMCRQEIADRMGLSVECVKARLLRAIAKMRKAARAGQ